MAEEDAVSNFSYDGEADPDAFSLHQLGVAVASHFGRACELKKMAEGGFHKVYEVIQEDGTVLGVVRVAAPAFPKDKLESEVATLKYLAARSQIPVPQVYAWNSDASNPVGAEYMILEKVRGVPADSQWETLPMDVKKIVVSQVAKHLTEMFSLRFERAGSLYLSSPFGSDIHVGPIIGTPFYRAIDGIVRVPDAPLRLSSELSRYRGPFSTTSDYLQSFILAELHVLSHYRPAVKSYLGGADAQAAERQVEAAERTLRKALELCTVYPGDYQPGGKIKIPTQKFTLRLDDFRLSNIMIDEKSGIVTGFIDFEGTTAAPLWECAVVPAWLLDHHEPEGSCEGGPAEEKQILLDEFCKVMRDEEWNAMYEYGKPFRRLTDLLPLRVRVWSVGSVKGWVDERLAWAKLHPGVAFPEKN